MEVQVDDLPYRHMVFASALGPELADAALKNLENMVWKHCIGDYYRFSVPRAENACQDLLSMMTNAHALDSVRAEIAKAFSVPLQVDCSLDIHRYDLGDGIGPHTDQKCREVRLVINLNRSWSSGGGIWILAADSRLVEDRKFLAPISDCGFAFLTSAKSYHAISIIDCPCQFALILKFRY